MSDTTLYATLRLKRRPVSNDIICYKLRVAHSLPVHKHALHECDVSDYAAMHDVNELLAQLAAQYKCGNVELDYKKDVAARMERNAR